MRTAILLAAVMPLACMAQPVAVAPWMTGAALVELYDGGDVSDIKAGYGHFTREDRIDLRREMAKARARAYVDGIHDATEGKQWCFDPAKPAPSSLHDEVFWTLRAMPSSELRRNAGDLIVDIWRRNWPCGGQS